VAPCRSCGLNWRFGGTYRFHLQDRKTRERGTSVSSWLQHTPPPPPDMILYRLWPASCWRISTDPSPPLSIDFPCAPSPFRFLYSWEFSTGALVYSHLLTLVPRSRIFLPWRWRRYVPPKCRFTHDLHSDTSQKTAFFIVTAVKTSNLNKNSFPVSKDLYRIRFYII
jgi:hypothetical protein